MISTTKIQVKITIPDIILCHLLFLIVASNMACRNNNPLSVHKYYLIEKCHRYKLGVITRANITSLNSCRRLSIEKKALAFNFSPREVTDSGIRRLDYTCEVLKCAEVAGGLSLANDTTFDYYSLYAKPIPHVNATCVPAIGMFHLLEKRLNYTEAENACKNLSGVLADVTTEKRTENLAQTLAGAKVDAAYVALKRLNTSKFYIPNGDSLDCSTHRAWALGHPRKSFIQFDCTVITRYKTWRSVSCKELLPSLCELLPGGPYRIGSIFPENGKPSNFTSIPKSK